MKTLNWLLTGALAFAIFSACSNPPPPETDPAPKAKKSAIRVQEGMSKEDSLAAAEAVPPKPLWDKVNAKQPNTKIAATNRETNLTFLGLRKCCIIIIYLLSYINI